MAKKVFDTPMTRTNENLGDPVGHLHPRKIGEDEMKTALTDQLVGEINSLSYDKKRQVIDFIKQLKSIAPAGTPMKEWMKLAGVIDQESLAEMEAAIEDGCEKVDPSEW